MDLYRYDIIITMVTNAKYQKFAEVKEFDEGHSEDEVSLYSEVIMKNFLSEYISGSSKSFISAFSLDEDGKLVYLNAQNISEIEVEIYKK